MNNNIIEMMKANLKSSGYSFNINGDFEIEIPFLKCNVRMYQTLSDKLFVKVFDLNDNVVAKNSYKTVNGAMKFMRKNTIN